MRPSSARPRPTWWTQVILAVGFAWGYDEVRELHGNIVAAGLHHGLAMLQLDQLLHLEWGSDLNQWLAPHHTLATSLSGYYVVMHLGMTSLVLLLMWWRCRTYRRHRNALLLLSLVGLVVYWLYPVAPPRLLPGFHDTVRQHIPAAYTVEAAKANLYAAMPSLHMAWAMWCGVALWALSGRWWVRAVAVVHPALTVLTVLATGNHYAIDLLAGAALVPVGYAVLWVAEWLRRTASELHQRRVAQQQPLAADLGTEVDLGLRGVRLATHRHHPAEAERVVGDAVAGRQRRDGPQPRPGNATATHRLVRGDLGG